MWYLAHGNGVDDIALMVAVIVLGLLLLRRSERSVRTRAQETATETDQAPAAGAATGAADVESAVVDPSENDGNSV